MLVIVLKQRLAARQLANLDKRMHFCSLLLLLAVLCVRESAATGTSYQVSLSQRCPGVDVNENIALLGQDVAEAKRQGSRLIIFPEFSMFEPANRTYTASVCQSFNVTDPPSHPCSQSPSTVAGVLSCMAMNNSIWMVANYCNEQVCSGSSCNQDGLYVWNSNLVFDPNGYLVAEYRKSHVYLHDIFDEPAEPDYVTFNTSFPQTFGMFMCKDILYPTPGPELRKRGIQTFAYNSMIPIKGVSGAAFALWSYIHDATLLAADCKADTGGVYIKGKKVSKDVNGVLTASVPTTPP